MEEDRAIIAGTERWITEQKARMQAWEFKLQRDTWDLAGRRLSTTHPLTPAYSPTPYLFNGHLPTNFSTITHCVDPLSRYNLRPHHTMSSPNNSRPHNQGASQPAIPTNTPVYPGGNLQPLNIEQREERLRIGEAELRRQQVEVAEDREQIRASEAWIMEQKARIDGQKFELQRWNRELAGQNDALERKLEIFKLKRAALAHNERNLQEDEERLEVAWASYRIALNQRVETDKQLVGIRSC